MAFFNRDPVATQLHLCDATTLVRCLRELFYANIILD